MTGYAVRQREYRYLIPGAPDDCVDGLLIDGLTEADLARVDRYEGTRSGLYVRRVVLVLAGGGERRADVYLAGPASGLTGSASEGTAGDRSPVRPPTLPSERPSTQNDAGGR